MSLQVWLPLNGDLHNQGLTEISIINNSTTINNNGKIGKCLHFSNTEYITMSPGFLPQTGKEFSCCYWVKELANNTVSSFRVVYECGQFIVGQYGSKFNVYQTSGGLDISTTIDSTIWVHCCVTVDATGLCKIYTNGQYQTQKTISTYPNSGTTTIGRRTISGTNTHNNFLVNDFRIYDHALSAKEVEEIAKGLILHYKLDQSNSNILTQEILHTAPFASATTFVGNYEGYSDVLSVRNNTLYQKTSSGKNDIFTGITWDGDIQYTLSGLWRDDRTDGKNSSMQFRFHYTDNTTTTIKSPQSKWGQWIPFKLTSAAGKSVDKITTTYGNAGDIYIASFKLEIGSNQTPFLDFTPNNIIYDSSGYNNNGTIIGSLEATAPSPRYSCATKFDNLSYIKKTDFIYDSNIWSVSLWYLKSTNPTAYECLFCLSQGDGGDSNKKIAACPNSGRIWYKGESGSSSISQLKINEWTNLIMTCNGTTVTIYQNGNLIGTFSASTALTGRTDLVIGARASAENVTNIAIPYTGDLSDFRIYATAFTAEQVKELYQNSLIVDGTNIIPRDLE